MPSWSAAADSSRCQGRSGLGLEAQRDAIALLLGADPDVRNHLFLHGPRPTIRASIFGRATVEPVGVVAERVSRASGPVHRLGSRSGQ